MSKKRSAFWIVWRSMQLMRWRDVRVVQSGIRREKRTKKSSFIWRRDSYSVTSIEYRTKVRLTEVVRYTFWQRPEGPVSRRRREVITLLLNEGMLHLKNNRFTRILAGDKGWIRVEGRSFPNSAHQVPYLNGLRTGMISL